MHDHSYLSVLIPTYNEEHMITKMIKRIIDAVPNAEIVVVDDGSTDRTVSTVENLKISTLRLIKSFRNKGKGYAVREGIRHISRPITVQIDADLQFLPEEIPKLIKPLLEGEADIVFGSRYLNPKNIEKDSISFFKRIASFITSILVSSICLKCYTDVFAGMKAWRSKALQDIDIKTDDFGYEAEIAIMAKKKHYMILELPVTYKKRLLGESKIRIFRDAFRVLNAIFKTAFSRVF